MAFKDFTAGDILTAADVDTYLMRQTVMVFADSTARSSALGTAIITEGMVTYLTGSNALEYYDGSAWQSVIYTPTTPNAGTAISAAFTASSSQANSKIYANGTTAYTITIPDVLSVDQTIEIYRDSSGTVSIAAGTGVTTWAGAGTAGTAVVFNIDQQYNGAAVTKVGANSYRVIGKVAV